MKVAGVWRYVYRARVPDQHGQVIDVYVSTRRDIASAHRDEEEEAPPREAEGPQQFVHRWHVQGGLCRDEGVDLEGQAELGRPEDGGESAVEGSLDPADRVVTLRGGPRR